MTTSNPEIGDATGYWDNVNKFGDIFILWKNTSGYGYVKLESGNNDGKVVQSTLELCANIKTGLYFRTRMEISSVFTYGFARAYKCDSDAAQNCNVTPPTCTKRVLTSSFLDFPIYAADYTTPSTPTGLSVTAGDGFLEFIWNEVSNMFAYHLALTDPTNVIEIGHKRASDTRYYKFKNLTNGVTYTLHLKAINHSGSASNEATKSGTPSAPLSPSCVFTVT